MWTLYAAGLNPQSFAATEAAIVQNTYPEPDKFPKMIWATNYYRLAAATMFTLFFAGKVFAPKCIIDGVNIQEYLQSHFLRACEHLARRIHEAGGIENDVVFGWESLNEPNKGMTASEDISVIPKEQALKKGTCPTIWQTILTGSGRAVEVDTWDMGGLGPYKVGRSLIDPHGEIAWLPVDYDESRYGYKRGEEWKLGECIWAQHGVWDPSTDTLLKKDYFSKHPVTGDHIDYQYFADNFFMDFFRSYRDTIRSIHEDAIILLQGPAMELPPKIKGTPDGDDPLLVYAPHWYDGITLMTKKWNRTWNVDVVGVLRGRYWHPSFAIKIGETAIRNCFRDQHAALRQEGLDYLGNHPCIMTEFGIPYDMDDKYAYKTGDYSSQSAAMDANHFAVESSGLEGYTLWLYTTDVSYYYPPFTPARAATNTAPRHRMIMTEEISGTAKTFPFSRSMTNCSLSLLSPRLPTIASQLRVLLRSRPTRKVQPKGPKLKAMIASRPAISAGPLPTRPSARRRPLGSQN